MKEKFNNIINIFGLSIGIFLTACSDNEADSAYLKLSADKMSVEVGEEVNFTINHSVNNVVLYTGDDGFNFDKCAYTILKDKSQETIENTVLRPTDESIIPYSIDLSLSVPGEANIQNDLMMLCDANSGNNLLNSQGVVELDPILGKNVLKVNAEHPEWWSQALRFCVNTKIGSDKQLTIRMKFDKTVLTNVNNGQEAPAIKTFPVVIRLAGMGKDDQMPIFNSATVWNLYAAPLSEYSDYTYNLLPVIEAWEKAVGKKMETLSYIQVLFTTSSSAGYVGSYYVESAKYGDYDYKSFDLGHAIPVNDNSGIVHYSYKYDKPGTYRVVALGVNSSYKNYSGSGYKDDRAGIISASEYDYCEASSSIEITVNE